jgi:hypothetical protein
MLNVMAKDVVTNDVGSFPQCLFKLIDALVDPAFRGQNGRLAIKSNCGDVENPGGLGIDFEVDRKTPFHQGPSVLGPEFHEVEKCHLSQRNGRLDETLEPHFGHGNRSDLTILN